METFNSLHEITSDHVGLYIRLQGHGILDGLKGSPTKEFLYRIVRVNHFSESNQCNGLLLRAFNAINSSFLPEYNFSQQVEIYTKAEQKKMKRFCQ